MWHFSHKPIATDISVRPALRVNDVDSTYLTKNPRLPEKLRTSKEYHHNRWLILDIGENTDAIVQP